MVLRLLLFICKRTSVLGICYLFTKDCSPSLPVIYTKAAVLVTRFVYKGLCPCLSLFICKGLLSLSFAIHLQRTAVLVFWLFIFKGLLSLSGVIYLQRTAVLVLCYSFAKDCSPCGIHLQRTAVLVLCYLFSKDCGPCLVPLVCKETTVLIFRFCPTIKMDCSPRGTAFLPGLVKKAVA